MNTTESVDINCKKASEGDKLIEAKRLKKSFGNNEIFKDVSFELHDDENLVIMGKSGTGKSVLIKCIIGLLEADAGTLKVLNQNLMNIGESEMNELRKHVGYLFQGGALYDSMTVERNLKFPLRRLQNSPRESQIDELVNEMLDNVGLIHAKHKMPAELSGGMKKRIALARTLVMKPKIMLYDEPTSGLDMITSNEISDLILKMRKKYKMSSIIITHDISCVDKTADRILILDQGTVLCQGSHQEVRNNKGKEIRSYFETSSQLSAN